MPKVTRIAVVALLLLGFVSTAHAETKAYLWKVVSFTADGRTDVWGGRVLGSVPLGRLSLVARLDASALPGQFKAEDPSTYKSVEGYAGANYVFAQRDGVTVGPAVVAGLAMAYDTKGKTLTSNPTTWGVGGRLGTPSGWVYVMVGQHGAAGRRIGILMTGQWKVTDTFSLVADGVASDKPFARVGIAVSLTR